MSILGSDFFIPLFVSLVCFLMLSCLIGLCVFIVVNMKDVVMATTKNVISMTSRLY